MIRGAHARRTRAVFAVCAGCVMGALVSSVALPALATDHPLDPATAEADVKRARDDGTDAFCTKPERPLSRRARALCGMAEDIKGCQGFLDACKGEDQKAAKEPEKPKDPPKISEWLASLVRVAGQVVLWLLVLAIIVAIAIPVVQAILKARRDKKVADPTPPAVAAPQAVAVAQVEELESISDAELLLRRAEDHMRRGELERATLTYLNAALRSLDQRGAIRIARHRTNGEYVRGCKDANAKQPLREIVREVDKVQFGGTRPTEETARNVAARATALVRAMPLMVLTSMLALFVAGCGDVGRGPTLRNADPAGDELMMELLKRQGMSVGRLAGSLATLPMPTKEQPSPAVVVDLERTTLEDETRAHLERWVASGGVLILAGDPSEWPAPLTAKSKPSAGSTDVTVAIPIDGDEDDPNEELTHFEHAKIARASTFAWEKSEKGTYELATLKSGGLYAATHSHGDGVMLGLANDDLLTNAALARPGNAAALVALFSVVDRTHDFKVARPEDGISPPTNPISALHRAGLGLGLWHALGAALIMFLAVGMRQARAKVTPPPARRAFTEHVEATGALYARTRISTHALAAYARYADERLRAKMPRGMSDPSAFLASRTGGDPARCAEIWSRAMAARSGDSPRGDELAVLRELSALFATATKAD